jgi:hypothetical protein
LGESLLSLTIDLGLGSPVAHPDASGVVVCPGKQGSCLSASRDAVEAGLLGRIGRGGIRVRSRTSAAPLTSSMLWLNGLLIDCPLYLTTKVLMGLISFLDFLSTRGFRDPSVDGSTRGPGAGGEELDFVSVLFGACAVRDDCKVALLIGGALSSSLICDSLESERLLWAETCELCGVMSSGQAHRLGMKKLRALFSKGDSGAVADRGTSGSVHCPALRSTRIPSELAVLGVRAGSSTIIAACRNDKDPT